MKTKIRGTAFPIFATIALVAVSALADTIQAYRINLRATDAGETAWLVGQDGVERPCVLVTPEEYDMLTGRLDRVWAALNSTRDGRVKLHGRIMNTTIDEVAKEKVETHKDGYQHREKIPVKVDRPKVVLKQKPDMATQPKPTNISERHFEMRKRLAERAKNPVKQITIEHDATTGKDMVTK